MSSFTAIPDDSLSFRELELALENTHIVNIKPNFIYLINNWHRSYYKLLDKNKSNMFLHNDGWLEVNVNLDSAKMSKVLADKEKIYRDNILPKAHFSKIRYNYLRQTISLLKNHGKVYLVRLPIHEKIMQVEKELMPNFNVDIKEAIASANGFLDLTNKNSDFNYTDGNHLDKVSGEIVSKTVAYWIYNLEEMQVVNKVNYKE